MKICQGAPYRKTDIATDGRGECFEFIQRRYEPEEEIDDPQNECLVSVNETCLELYVPDYLDC